MILGTQLIISAYGFWLPNDPRGSWSDFVGSWELYKFGPATKVTDRRDYSKDPHDATLRREAKKALKYPPVRFTDTQRSAIASGFAKACRQALYPCLACCIGHDHAHLALGRHDRDPEVIAGHLKAQATRELTARGIHPLNGHTGKRGGLPTPWSEGCWKVFLDDEDQLWRAIQYVNRHPQKEGLPRQHWDFIGIMSDHTDGRLQPCS
jgi:REP element-mobilizing transposase RayT